jgi:hypothetical protein
MRTLGNCYLILLGVILCAAGGGFTWLMWRSFERAKGQEAWTAVPCRILESEVVERKLSEHIPSEYAHHVLFGYEWEGEARASELLSVRGVSWSSNSEKAERLVEKYPAGTTTECFVDPDDPDRAVLKKDSKGPGYSLWFPILFVVAGVGIIVGAVRRMAGADKMPRAAAETDDREPWQPQDV